MPNMTPTELMSDPKHMIARLRSLPPGQVVTADVMRARSCLGAAFLNAHGYEDVRWITDYGHINDKIVIGHSLIGNCICYLGEFHKGAVTAADALEAFAQVQI